MFDGASDGTANAQEGHKGDCIIIAIAVALMAVIIAALVAGTYTGGSVSDRFDNAARTGDVLVLVEHDKHTNMSVYVDVTNGVQYVSQQGTGIAPMLDADGSPIINGQWKEWKDAQGD